MGGQANRVSSNAPFELPTLAKRFQRFYYEARLAQRSVVPGELKFTEN